MMRAPESFIVSPLEGRYKRGIEIDGVVFGTVTSIEDAKDVSKKAVVVSVPLNYRGDIAEGDEVIVHHNIFRSYYNQHGKLTNSRAYLHENLYQVIPEELFLYKKDGIWIPNLDFCFVRPIEEDTISKLSGLKLPHTGVVVYSNLHKTEDPIGFTPESEYQVTVDDEILYRMRDCDISIYDRFTV